MREGHGARGEGQGARLRTGCTEGDGSAEGDGARGGARGAWLTREQTGTAEGQGAADHSHAQGGPAASPLGFPRRRCYKQWNNPGKPGPRACRAPP